MRHRLESRELLGIDAKTHALVAICTKQIIPCDMESESHVLFSTGPASCVLYDTHAKCRVLLAQAPKVVY